MEHVNKKKGEISLCFYNGVNNKKIDKMAENVVTYFRMAALYKSLTLYIQQIIRFTKK